MQIELLNRKIDAKTAERDQAKASAASGRFSQEVRETQSAD